MANCCGTRLLRAFWAVAQLRNHTLVNNASAANSVIHRMNKACKKLTTAPWLVSDKDSRLGVLTAPMFAVSSPSKKFDRANKNARSNLFVSSGLICELIGEDVPLPSR